MPCSGRSCRSYAGEHTSGVLMACGALRCSVVSQVDRLCRGGCLPLSQQ